MKQADGSSALESAIKDFLLQEKVGLGFAVDCFIWLNKGRSTHIVLDRLTSPSLNTHNVQGIELAATRLSVDQTLYVPAYNSKASYRFN